MELHRARRQESGGQADPGRSPSFRGTGWVGLAPCPHTLPTQELPLYTLSISRGTWCYTLVLSLFLRGGRREGQPLRDPPPWGSSEDGADTSWAVSPPPAHQDPLLAAVQLVPKHRNPHAGLGHAISWPPWPPFPGPIAVPRVRRLPPHPVLGTALLLSWNSSARLSIRPSILVRFGRPAPLAGWVPPPSTRLTCRGSLGPASTPSHTHLRRGPEPLGVRSCTSRGHRNLPPTWVSPHAVLYPRPHLEPLYFRAFLPCPAHLYVSRCDRSINILFFVLDIWGLFLIVDVLLSFYLCGLWKKTNKKNLFIF